MPKKTPGSRVINTRSRCVYPGVGGIPVIVRWEGVGGIPVTVRYVGAGEIPVTVRSVGAGGIPITVRCIGVTGREGRTGIILVLLERRDLIYGLFTAFTVR